jgi:hypothetical protein
MPTHPRMTHKQTRSRTVSLFVCCFDACSSCSVRFPIHPCGLVRLLALPATRTPAGHDHLHCHHHHSINPSLLYTRRCTFWCGVVWCVCLAWVDCAGHTPFPWVSLLAPRCPLPAARARFTKRHRGHTKKGHVGHPSHGSLHDTRRSVRLPLHPPHATPLRLRRAGTELARTHRGARQGESRERSTHPVLSPMCASVCVCQCIVVWCVCCCRSWRVGCSLPLP